MADWKVRFRVEEESTDWLELEVDCETLPASAEQAVSIDRPQSTEALTATRAHLGHMSPSVAPEGAWWQPTGNVERDRREDFVLGADG